MAVKLPWQHDDSSPTDAAASSADSSSADGASASAATDLPPGYTPPKGRPTPKRRDQEIAKGVRRDPNLTSPEQASKHRKELKKSMSKEEWKEYKRKEKEARRERNRAYRERMDSGDERYLLDRDKGPARRYVRDWVDSKRFLSNLFMPFALVLLLVMLLSTSFSTQVAAAIVVVMWIMIAIFFVDAVIIGTRANRALKRRYPDTTEAGFRLGFYAVSRATQPRRWRTPRPQVEIGATV